ncbi:glycosyltransferase [Mitsuaria sp. GD03876]|uniref:glycosyltransferase family 2 protein n=1 Tax=Mitsuaria sp. GD03876 TaxID=2975399 RepID=UPI00244C9F4A|nr:glycosyltransferase [Mitsuaria sp. GD03876]MDH0868292.1 glycosyltransferase [Mitsuaria sp. GD03876]
MHNEPARPTVSVIIPAYNAAKHIAKAVDSVLAQTRPVDQVIVVNDGSTDATATVLAGYGDRIEVISIPNGGVSNARNTGLRAARGDLIALLDADDLWSVEKIERQVRVFAQHPGVEFTCCNFLSVDLGRQLTHNRFELLEARLGPFTDRVLPRPAGRLLECNVVGTCSNVMFTRSLLDRVGPFDTSLRQAEDFELWLRMALATDFFLQSDVLMEKVDHGANLTSRWDETLRYHEQAVLRFHERHAAAFAADPALERAHRRGLADVRYELAGILFAKGRRAEGFAALRQAWAPERSPANAARIAKRALRRLLLRDDRRATVDTPQAGQTQAPG